MTELRILGLDGLDMELAKQWGYTNLLQHQHGKLEVPISKRYGYPHSPDVWASFLTGQWYDNLRFMRPHGTQYFLDAMHYIRDKVGSSLGLGLIGSLIYKHTTTQFPKLDVPVFDMKMYNVPYVNYDGRSLKLMHAFNNDELSVWETCIALRTQLSDRIEHIDNIFKGNDCFAFIGEIDLLQHFIPKVEDVERLREVYGVLNTWVRDIDDLLIICDHGFDFTSGMHSSVGYWSTNTELGYIPHKITDFHRHIVGVEA